jgi:hypothetical protein
VIKRIKGKGFPITSPSSFRRIGQAGRRIRQLAEMKSSMISEGEREKAKGKKEKE